MLTAETKDLQPAGARQQGADGDDGARACQSERQRNQGPFTDAKLHEAFIDERPDRQAGEGETWLRPRAIGQREYAVREQIAGIEIHEARAEFVDGGPA